MTEDKFKILHSQLILQVQLIENDLRLIYASIKEGDFEDNLDDLETASLGKISSALRRVDRENGHPDLSADDYRTIDRIREIRNYWCHQCYLDFVYISDDEVRKKAYDEVFSRLQEDEDKTWTLQNKLERIRNRKLIEYGRMTAKE